MEIAINSWKEFRASVSGAEFSNWAFRGQTNSGWPVLSTLSRYFRDFRIHQGAQSQQEERILRIFRRKAHHYLSRTPDEMDVFEWLALMQHHGAPTRLIDFTWSPYVAAFFALERATADAAVWALFPPDVTASVEKTGQLEQEALDEDRGPWISGNYDRFFLTNEHRFVVIGEPMQMNKRLIAQGGTFVVPGVLNTPVEELVADASSTAVVKFVLSTENVRKEAMRDLYKMNITHATLFPDIDGLARSLAFELEYHWAFDPATMERYRGYDGESV